MKRLLVMPVLFSCFLISCETGEKSPRQVSVDTSGTGRHIDITATKVAEPVLSQADELKWEDVEVMDYKEIKYRGKLPLYFSVNDFEQVFGKLDSLLPVSTDPPCNDGLFWYRHDGSISPETLDEISQYWFKNGSRYERYGDSIAVDNFMLQGGNFITFKGTRFDEHSTIDDFKKIFPNAVKGLGNLNVQEEGTLQVFIVKEEPGNVSDGHIKLFFRDGRFYMMHHWFPC